MIRWFSSGEKLPGFSYYPLLEIGVGVFLLTMSLIVPILFVIYNGVRFEQWPELLFCAGFLVLFFFMGKSLTFQSLQACRTESGFAFSQNMREPPVSLQLKSSEWQGIRTDDEQVGDETVVHLQLKTTTGVVELYRSINRKEINKMVGALELLRKKAEEE